MVRTILKYLLSFCFLFLSVSGHMHAQLHNDHTSHIAAKDHTRISKVYPTDIFMLKPASSGIETQHQKLHALLCENEENDETSSFKEYVKNDNYFITDFSAQAPENKDILSSYGDLSYTSFCRYLTLQVFRI